MKETKVIIIALIMFLLISMLNAGDFFVSKKGYDGNPGTIDRPFLTIQKAADAIKPGDTCYIRKGTYRETVIPGRSGKKGMPVRFFAYNNEKVIIKGTEIIKNWKKYKQKIYASKIDWPAEQIFVDDKMMLLARYPNSTLDLFNPSTMKLSNNKNDITRIFGPKIKPGWDNGLVCGLFNSMWHSKCGYIISSKKGEMKVKEMNFGEDSGAGADWTLGAGKGFVSGIFSELDAPGEWFYKDSLLYIWLPDSDKPEKHSIEAKQRNYGFILDNREYIEIHGLNFFGTSISMDKANNCIIRNCRLKYIDHFMKTKHAWMRHSWTRMHYLGKGIPVFGDNNIFHSCDISFSAGDGLLIMGDDNKVINCVIHDCDYSGNMCTAISINGKGNTIISNTIYNTGNYGIHPFRPFRKGRIMFNNVFNVGLIASDLGCIYTALNGGDGTEIAYNWFHDNKAEHIGNGIYLDLCSTNYSVHHNVVWNCNSHNLSHAVAMNLNSVNISYFNNTFINNSGGIHQGNANKKWISTNVKVFNNLTEDNIVSAQGFGGFDMSHNLENTGSGVINEKMVPIKNSKAHDKGRIIPGITDNYKGKAPDIGAYELGGEYWTAGSSLYKNIGPYYKFKIFIPELDIYTEKANIITGFWEAYGKLTVLQNGAYEGKEHYQYKYKLKDWWDGVGLDLTSWGAKPPHDFTKYTMMKIAYKGPAKGHGLIIRLTSLNEKNEKVHSPYVNLPQSDDYIIRNILLKDFLKNKEFQLGKVVEIGVAVSKSISGEGILYFDSIQFGTYK